jgi:hypothetical protein
MGRKAGEPVWLPPRERSANEDWRLMLPKPKGECERMGMGALCDMDIERSEVGVLSSTAEVEGGGWEPEVEAWRVEIWACWVRIMLRRRFYGCQHFLRVYSMFTRTT